MNRSTAEQDDPDTGYPRHPASAVLPDLEPAEYAALRDSVAADGLRDPIWLYRGEVLDGWHRLRACRETGVAPRFREYQGDKPWGFVLALQRGRRNLSTSQWAAVAADLREPLAAEAAERQRRTAGWGEAGGEFGRLGGRPSTRNPLGATLRQGGFRGLDVPDPGGDTARELAVEASGGQPTDAPALPAPLPESSGAGVAALPRAAPPAQDSPRRRMPRSAGVVAAALPTSARSVERAARVRAADPALFEQIRAGRLTVTEAERAVRVQEHAGRRVEPPPLSAAGTFPVLMADPPWRYEQGTTSPSRIIENHYPTMALDEIKALCPPADPDAVMFLWATNPLLAEALGVLAAWGFAYRDNLVWVKDRMGLGHVFRGQHELLLVGVRGQGPAPGPGGPALVATARPPAAALGQAGGRLRPGRPDVPRSAPGGDVRPSRPARLGGVGKRGAGMSRVGLKVQVAGANSGGAAKSLDQRGAGATAPRQAPAGVRQAEGARGAGAN